MRKDVGKYRETPYAVMCTKTGVTYLSAQMHIETVVGKGKVIVDDQKLPSRRGRCGARMRDARQLGYPGTAIPKVQRHRISDLKRRSHQHCQTILLGPRALGMEPRVSAAQGFHEQRRQRLMKPILLQTAPALPPPHTKTSQTSDKNKRMSNCMRVKTMRHWKSHPHVYHTMPAFKESMSRMM